MFFVIILLRSLLPGTKSLLRYAWWNATAGAGYKTFLHLSAWTGMQIIRADNPAEWQIMQLDWQGINNKRHLSTGQLHLPANYQLATLHPWNFLKIQLCKAVCQDWLTLAQSTSLKQNKDLKLNFPSLNETTGLTFGICKDSCSDLSANRD